MSDLFSTIDYFAALLGLVAGAASMLVYARFSPQTRLQALQGEIAALQQQMAAFDGDFSGALALSRQNLRLAFRRLGLVLGPAVVSGVPVLAVLPLVGSAYIVFFVCVAVAALTTKHLGQIA